MVWYARHPDALTKVYEKVNQRLKAERDGINHLIALRDNKPKESSPGDSIDVWRGRHICYLTGTPTDNKLTFTLPSDTNFKDRDTLRWTVRFRFLNGTPDSLHAPLMAMQVLTASPAAWVFVWWTFANLVPRANAIYGRYRKEFGDEAVGKRKRIIPYIY